MLQQLPISFAEFTEIRKDNCVYVDKTQYVYQLAKQRGMYFLSRPRRFGKSMTLWVFKALFEGKRELFKDLWIDEHWDWSRKPNPVVHISFKNMLYHQLGLENALAKELHSIAAEYGLALRETISKGLLKELLYELSKTNKVVVLIDEYDVPITHYLTDKFELARENQELLKEFYTTLKENDSTIEFVFITGVSKFAKVGIFSGLNNIKDISMSEQYSTMFGYTQEELETVFEPHLAAAGEKLNLNRADLLEKMRFWYNGYRFEIDAQTVYNPVSVNSFLDEKKFTNFWFETGTPTFLVNHLKEHGVFLFHNEAVSSYSFNSFNIENLDTWGLLFQTGYLTIKGIEEDDDDAYYLGYPNYEVEKSMITCMLEGFSGLSLGAGVPLSRRLEKAFINNDIDAAISVLKTIFKNIPYQIYEQNKEAFFHAAVYLFFTYMGFRVHSEVSLSDGRCDTLLETKTHFFIMEFKLDKKPEVALKQIIDKDYAQAYRNKGKEVVGIGIVFSSETRNISAWTSAVL